MSVLAIIPARGGSKGIKRKNLVPFNGKPLVAHSILHALASREIDRVLVSTDDEEIRRVAICSARSAIRSHNSSSASRPSGRCHVYAHEIIPPMANAARLTSLVSNSPAATPSASIFDSTRSNFLRSVLISASASGDRFFSSRK